MKSWPHAPSKSVDEPGTYIITSATYQKVPHFRSKEHMDRLTEEILERADKLGWKLQAWSVFQNHYHLIGQLAGDEPKIRKLTKAIHGKSAIWLNQIEATPGRVVWYRTWDSRITYEKSYLARLRYVHENAVRHGIVDQATDYRWCSAKWFEDRGDKPFVETVRSFEIDRVNVYDDFEVDPDDLR